MEAVDEPAEAAKAPPISTLDPTRTDTSPAEATTASPEDREMSPVGPRLVEAPVEISMAPVDSALPLVEVSISTEPVDWLELSPLLSTASLSSTS